MAPAGITRPGRRHLSTALKVAVSAGLVLLLLSRTGVAEIGHTLASAHIGWLVIGLLLGIVAAMLQANQWRGLLAAYGVPLTYWRSLRLDTAARLFDAALPTSIGGDVVRVRLASTRRGDAPAAALAVALRRVLQVPGLLLVIAIALAASWHLDYSGPIRAISLAGLGAGAVVGAVVIVLRRTGGHRRMRLPRKLEQVRHDLTRARHESADGTRPFRRALARGLLFWCVVALSQTCFIHAVGIDAPLEYSVAVVACVNAISMLPISVGGYGLREGAFGALLGVGGLGVGGLGVGGVGTVAQGTAVGLILSAQTLAFGLIGAVVYLTLPRTSREPRSPVKPVSQARLQPPSIEISPAAVAAAPAPSTQSPATQSPATQSPASQAPASQAPASQYPATPYPAARTH